MGWSYGWWNVMEFLIGFLGGLGMAYAVITTKWPKTSKVSDNGNWFALIFIVIFVPMINYVEQFSEEDFLRLAKELKIVDVAGFVQLNQSLVFGIMAVVAAAFIILWRKYKDDGKMLVQNTIPVLTLIFSLFYIVCTILKHGLHYQGFPIGVTTTLYLPLLFVAYVMWYVNRNKKVVFTDEAEIPVRVKTWLIYTGVLLLFLFVLALIINGYFGGDAAPKRFK
jgi:hypothetical protein